MTAIRFGQMYLIGGGFPRGSGGVLTLRSDQQKRLFIGEIYLRLSSFPALRSSRSNRHNRRPTQPNATEGLHLSHVRRRFSRTPQ
jgi:hypothetical protein